MQVFMAFSGGGGAVFMPARRGLCKPAGAASLPHGAARAVRTLRRGGRKGPRRSSGLGPSGEV